MEPENKDEAFLPLMEGRAIPTRKIKINSTFSK
jgi:hypothetical protein